MINVVHMRKRESVGIFTYTWDEVSVRVLFIPVFRWRTLLKKEVN